MAITVNGHEYASWDDVPEDLRATLRSALPDGDHDGVPDLVQGVLPQGSHVRTTSMTITVGDQVYDSLDEVPEPMRSALRQAGITGPQAPGTTPPPVVAVPPLATGPVPGPAPDPGGVLLNGAPVDVGAPRKRHWWNRNRTS